MEKAYNIMHFLLRRRKQRASRRLVRMRSHSLERRRNFGRKQAYESLQFFILMIVSIISMSFPSPRCMWMKERSNHWWEHVVKTTFMPQDWLNNFRVSRATFEYLCIKLRPFISKSDTVMRKAVTTEKRVALTLWFLATGSEYRTIGHLFGIAKSTVCVATKEVCTYIVDKLLPEYIRMPQANALKEVVSSFASEYNFPQCVGAVDGTHIPITSPQECPADYFNRKGWHSVIMQGTVNNRGLFIDVYIGWPGRVHDARVFVNSSLFKKGRDEVLFPNWIKKMGNKDVPLVLLGDPAYPLLSWLMKPFTDNGHLTTQQRNFNYRLSRARVVVEHSYGRLKGRWRCLLKRLDVKVEDVPQLVAACCVLHNICEVHGDSFNQEWVEGIQVDAVGSAPSASSSRSKYKECIYDPLHQSLKILVMLTYLFCYFIIHVLVSCCFQMLNV